MEFQMFGRPEAKDVVIVSRHPATVEYIREELEKLFRDVNSIPVLASATVEDCQDKKVWGNVPLNLASVAKTVHAVEFSGAPPRGQEYTLADMKAGGVVITEYKVMTNEAFADYMEGLVE